MSKILNLHISVNFGDMGLIFCMITFIDFKRTISNIGSYGAPSFIFGLCQSDKYENEDNLKNENNLKNEDMLEMNII